MNWWANRLSGQQQNAPAHVVSQPSPAPPQQQPKQQPRPVRQEEQCPSCYSGNYMAATPNSQKRCFDCGYPLVQSGSGVGSTQSDAPAKQAVQVQGGGYHPTTIIGRVE